MLSVWSFAKGVVMLLITASACHKTSSLSKKNLKQARGHSIVIKNIYTRPARYYFLVCFHFCCSWGKLIMIGWFHGTWQGWSLSSKEKISKSPSFSFPSLSSSSTLLPQPQILCIDYCSYKLSSILSLSLVCQYSRFLFFLFSLL